jgi:hypothetical protein
MAKKPVKGVNPFAKKDEKQTVKKEEIVKDKNGKVIPNTKPLSAKDKFMQNIKKGKK